jgi:hypothetical protein
MTQKEIGTIRCLTLNELEIVSGGVDDGDEIVVTARRDGGGARSYYYDSLTGLDSGGGGFGFGFGGESGGGYGQITIDLDPIDSDGDGTPDENDEAPYDASNNTIVVTAPTIDVTAPFSREARDAARFALQQDQYINDIAGKFFEDPIYYFDRTAQLFGADPGLVNSLAEAGLDNRFVNYARQYDANRAAAEFFGVVGNEP